MSANMANDAQQPRIAVIGGGPAGLMAAERIAMAGYGVDVFDAMPSVARKFLLAGVGGMNITHAEDYTTFLSRYGHAAQALSPILDQLTPTLLRAWIHALGISTFVGSSGRVFPADMKAAPLLRRWLQRLRAQGVVFHPRHRWLGWVADDPAQGWRFHTPRGEVIHCFSAAVLALGGGSWPRLGSDGQWLAPLRAAGIDLRELRPSNCGFEIGWSAHLREHFAGSPLKNVRLTLCDLQGETHTQKGELLLTDYGMEGSLIYALSAPLRDVLTAQGDPGLTLDCLPDLSQEVICSRLRKARKGESFANLLRKQLRLPPLFSTLLRECCPMLDRQDVMAVAHALKHMPLQVRSPRPLEEAISSAGGVCFDALNSDLMLRQLPGIFVAGEMLDWEAPTGGYLLSACLATGRRAGEGLVCWLQAAASSSAPEQELDA